METTDYTDCTDFEWLVDGGRFLSLDGSRPASIFFEISKICEICGSAFSHLFAVPYSKCGHLLANDRKKKPLSLRKAALGKRMPFGLVRSGNRGAHVHAAPITVEGDAAVGEREQGVVAADADIEAGVELRAALADDDVTGDDGLAAELLHAETLAARVATVLDGALSFLMGHVWKG
jgi:hypothetical protein